MKNVFCSIGNKGNYNYLEILKVDRIKQAEMKKITKKDYIKKKKKAS